MKRAILFILIIGGVAGLTFFFQKQTKNFFYLISEPFQKTLWLAGDKASDFFAAFFKAGVIIKENKTFQEKIRQLVREKVELQELKKENEFLKQALDLELNKEFNLEPAQITAKDISGDKLIIDKGLKDKIASGMPVITSQKVLIGRVSEVYQNFSWVVLVASKESSLDAKIVDKDIFGVVKGAGSLKLTLDLIPQDKEVKTGDIIITGSLSGIFPAGLLVGEIKSAAKSDLEPFQRIEAAVLFDSKELSRLFVVTKF